MSFRDGPSAGPTQTIGINSAQPHHAIWLESVSGFQTILPLAIYAAGSFPGTIKRLGTKYEEVEFGAR
jgi:hypothetical protein